MNSTVIKFSLLIFLSGCAFEGDREPAPIENESTVKNNDKLSHVIDKNIINPKPNRKKFYEIKQKKWSKSGNLIPISFENLDGWENQDFVNVWLAWSRNCQSLKLSIQLLRICRTSQNFFLKNPDLIKEFFEKNFLPHVIRSPQGIITGYYEPVVKGSRDRTSTYKYPIYKVPQDLIRTEVLDNGKPTGKKFIGKKINTTKGSLIVPYPTRKEIRKKGLLKGFELMFFDDPVDAFFIQIQGSAKIILPNNEIVRVGFAGSNGQKYISIGSWLINQKELAYKDASMEGIKKWISKNPSRLNELLNVNPRMIFFKEIESSLDLTKGPIGSLGIPLTANHSLAVDENFVELGLPIFLTTQKKFENKPKKGTAKLSNLMFAQDTGKAIKGANRGDYFFGSGKIAGKRAGKTKFKATTILLIPINKFN